MIIKQYAWEFDPYASNTLNFIKGERHVLQPDSGNGFHFFIPKAAPFFLKDIKVVHVQSGKVLDEGQDWQPGWAFELATRRTLMPVYGAICILDKTLNGTFEIEYRTLGGEYTLDQATLLEYLMNVAYDPRVTTWESIVDKPLYFNPLQHAFNVQDFVGMEDTIAALDSIRDAILQAAERIYPSLAIHLKDHDNPHATTKDQVGLGLVGNFPMATDAEAAAGTARNRYMSPATTAAMIAAISSESVAGHVSNKNNPHSTTKAHVGLSLVDNYATATIVEAEAGVATDKFVTVAGVAAMIRKLAVADVSAHIDDKNNPHETTKTHVGLGSVENLPIAGSAEYDAGVSDRHYTVVQGVKTMIDKFALGPLNLHIADKNNPHATTKGHVGLGNVANYTVADNAALDAGTASDRYVVVAGVKRMIDRFAIAALNTHIGDNNNPHNTTKAQVGLGSVEDYGIATDTELDAGTATNKYVVVYGVKRMIDRFAVTPLNNHIADKDNPHDTTKEHVGLGNVENYEVAADSDADTGTATDKYAVVATVKRMINRFAVTPLNEHIADKANPHETTKAHVGLGLVENYATATLPQAIEGTANNLFLTPEGLTAFFRDRFPNLGVGTMVTRLKLPAPPTGGEAWIKLVEHPTTDGSAGHFFVYGLTDDGNYIQLHTTPTTLVVEDYNGALITGVFCHFVNTGAGKNEIYYRREGAVVDISILKVGSGGTLQENDTADWILTEPANVVYPALRSRFLEQQLVSMWQDYNLAYGLNEAADAIAGKTATVLTTVTLPGKTVDESDVDYFIHTWTGQFVVPASGTIRLALGEFGVYGGTVKVLIDTVQVIGETITTPTVVYDNVPITAGTKTVKLELKCPRTIRYPNLDKGYIRIEQLV